MIIRKLRDEETALIIWIIQETPEAQSIIKGLKDLLVEEMEDGGMGSLRVYIDGEDRRIYGSDLGTGADFTDIDGVPVFFNVHLDTNGDFFELDVFKGDFSPLKQFPAINQLRRNTHNS